MKHEFSRGDLETIDLLLFGKAGAVIAMRDVWHGNHDPRCIALRHDVDDNHGSLDTALELAEWEHARGYKATYFLLHDSHYWQDVKPAAQDLVRLGHEVGLHNNAIAEGIRQNRDPHSVLAESLHHLRCAATVIGTVAHGDNLCYGPGRNLRFVNDELFLECDRGNWDGEKRSLWDYGLKYEANWLPRGDYLSESGGEWSGSVTERSYNLGQKQLHMLVHPDWWAAAFEGVSV